MVIVDALLFFGILFLSGKTLVLLRNRFQFKGLESQIITGNEQLSVAVCIPARNEESVIGKCLDSALTQSYPNLQVLVLNDRSEDSTADVIRGCKLRFGNKLTVLEGKDRSAGWLGKPWACHQLRLQARADILIFIDADTWLETDAVAHVVSAFENTGVDFVTVWPQQHTATFWEKIIVPLVYYALLSFLPIQYTERKPRWMPAFFHRKFKSVFAAACGQCMAFRAEAYDGIKGHEAVKNEVVEDVAIAHHILDQGYRMRMYHGMDAVHCRMYRSHSEIFNGFRKNFLAGFNHNIPLFLFMAVAHFITFVLPALVLLSSLLIEIPELTIQLSLVVFSLMIISRVILARWFSWSSVYAFVHPVGVLWFQFLGIRVLIDRISGIAVSWKGENISGKKP